jgi:hypothetical protein
MKFKNAPENNLGQDLPKGRVRFYKRDAADAALEFIGEDQIGHTPRDEKIELAVGKSADIVGERRQMDFQVDRGRQVMQESFEILLRNHKDTAVEVLIEEVLYRWSNWEIIRASHEYQKYDAQTIRFQVQVPKDGETVASYTVRYTW